MSLLKTSDYHINDGIYIVDDLEQPNCNIVQQLLDYKVSDPRFEPWLRTLFIELAI